MTTLTTNPQEHWETVIEQYLWGARCCVPASDAVRGYPATLLLLCVIDAIGQGNRVKELCGEQAGEEVVIPAGGLALEPQ